MINAWKFLQVSHFTSHHSCKSEEVNFSMLIRDRCCVKSWIYVGIDRFGTAYGENSWPERVIGWVWWSSRRSRCLITATASWSGGLVQELGSVSVHTPVWKIYGGYFGVRRPFFFILVTALIGFSWHWQSFGNECSGNQYSLTLMRSKVPLRC